MLQSIPSTHPQGAQGGSSCLCPLCPLSQTAGSLRSITSTPPPAQHIVLKAPALFQGVKVHRGGTGRDPPLSSPLRALRERSCLHFLLQHAQGQPCGQAPAPPIPLPSGQQSQTAAGARGATEALTGISPSSTLLHGARVCLRSPQQRPAALHQQNNHTGNKDNSTQESAWNRGGLEKQASPAARRSPGAHCTSQFLSSSEEAGCGSRSQGCLSAVTSHLRGTESPRAGRDALRSQSCCCRRAFPKASHHQRAVEDDALLWLAAFPVFVIQ